MQIKKEIVNGVTSGNGNTSRGCEAWFGQLRLSFIQTLEKWREPQLIGWLWMATMLDE
jgi:hypothetical protein